MSSIGSQAKRLHQALNDLAAFVTEKGAEFYHEMDSDVTKAKAPPSSDEWDHFLSLDAAIIGSLRACQIPYDPVYQPLEGTFEYGQTKLRVKDTKSGKVIIYSDKWLANIQSLTLQVCELFSSEQAMSPTCRITVEHVPGGDSSVLFNGKQWCAIKRESARFLEELIKAGPDVFRSTTEMRKANADLVDLTPKTGRLVASLPAEIAHLIERVPGKGSRLTSQAWIS